MQYNDITIRNATPDEENEYLTHDSIHFHKKMGYTKVAHFHECGRKFNRWFDMIWMEKIVE